METKQEHYSMSKCMTCKKTTAHRSGYCDDCRTITCKKCGQKAVVLVYGGRVCGKCITHVREKMRQYADAI